MEIELLQMSKNFKTRITGLGTIGLAWLWQRLSRTAVVVTILAILQNHLLIWAWASHAFRPTSYYDILAEYGRIFGYIGKILHLVR